MVILILKSTWETGRGGKDIRLIFSWNNLLLINYTAKLSPAIAIISLIQIKRKITFFTKIANSIKVRA
jgi:hypothetical protein